MYRQNFKELADRSDAETYTAMYEYIPIDVHAPVLELPDLVPMTEAEAGLDSEIDANGHVEGASDEGVPYSRTRSTTLSRAVIQGNLESARRDYEHTFRDLLALLKGMYN
jgi:hypothetical protein